MMRIAPLGSALVGWRTQIGDAVQRMRLQEPLSLRPLESPDRRQRLRQAVAERFEQLRAGADVSALPRTVAIDASRVQRSAGGRQAGLGGSGYAMTSAAAVR
jgi:hypothetical protein